MKRGRKPRINWAIIRNEYIMSEKPVTFRELSEKYNISMNSLQRKSMLEKWVKQREEFLQKIQQRLNIRIAKEFEKKEDVVDKTIEVIIQKRKDNLELLDNIEKLAKRELFRVKKIQTVDEQGNVVEKEVIEDLNDKALAGKLLEFVFKWRQILLGQPTEIIKANIEESISQLTMTELRRVITIVKQETDENIQRQILPEIAQCLPDKCPHCGGEL